MTCAGQSHYATLGVSQQATQDDVKRAFRKLARTFHPDVNRAPQAAERFKAVAAAYEVLSDTDQRRRYDASIQVRASLLDHDLLGFQLLKLFIRL